MCFRFCRSIDLDRILSYDSVKVVRYNDRRLGFIHYSSIFLILLYVIGYTILYEKRYLQVEAPQGSVRLSLLKPPTPVAMGDLKYCLQTQPKIGSFDNYQCLYWDESLTVYPDTEDSALFAATRVTIENDELKCNWTDPKCDYTAVNQSSTIYVADIEDFTLMIDHAMIAMNLGIQRNGQSLSGALLGINGTEMQVSSPNTVGVVGKVDILQLKVLMQAANITTLDSLLSRGGDASESMRYSGIILLVSIDYTNADSFNTSEISYTTSVRQVENTEFKAVQTLYTQFPNKVTYYNRHGIRILILQGGTIGAFDFQVLLLSLVSGLGLLAVSSLLVDSVAVYLLPQKKVYAKYKFENTVDFTDLREGRVHVSGSSDRERSDLVREEDTENQSLLRDRQ